MTSLDSIGICSLAPDSNSYAAASPSIGGVGVGLSPLDNTSRHPLLLETETLASASSSYASLRSPGLLASLNPNHGHHQYDTPSVKLNGGDEVDRSLSLQQEERFTSYAVLVIGENHSPAKRNNSNDKLSSFRGLENELDREDQEQNSSSAGENHMPSYLGISCAISGYSSYSRFCHSRDNSPARINGVSGPGSKLSILSSTVNKSPRSHLSYDSSGSLAADSRNSSICDHYFGSSDKKNYVTSRQITLRSAGAVSNGLNGTHDEEKVLINGTTTRGPITKMRDNEHEEYQYKRETTESLGGNIHKSLVQRRIESLFKNSSESPSSIHAGASNRMSRSKLRSPPIEAKRSPSCPPETFRASSRSPPVFRHVTKDFKEQLRNSPVPTKTVWAKSPKVTAASPLRPLPTELRPIRNGLSPSEAVNPPLTLNSLNTVVSSSESPRKAPRPLSIQSLPQSPILNHSSIVDDIPSLPNPPLNSLPKPPLKFPGDSKTITPQKIPLTKTSAGEAFLEKTEIETSKIKLEIASVEKELADSSAVGNSLPEEAKGKLRSAIGKANLLIDQKFKQFKDLCHKNINPDITEPFPTTEQDLAGFWDMVLLQVDDVNTVFNEIRALKANNWKEVESSVPYRRSVSSGAKPRTGRIGSSKSSPTTPERQLAAAAGTSKSAELAKAREEQRKKFLAAKKKGKLQVLQKSEAGDDIEIFVPEK